MRAEFIQTYILLSYDYPQNACPREGVDRNTVTDNNPGTPEAKIKPGIRIPLLEMVTWERDIASISLLLDKYKI